MTRGASVCQFSRSGPTSRRLSGWCCPSRAGTSVRAHPGARRNGAGARHFATSPSDPHRDGTATCPSGGQRHGSGSGARRWWATRRSGTTWPLGSNRACRLPRPWPRLRPQGEHGDPCDKPECCESGVCTSGRCACSIMGEHGDPCDTPECCVSGVCKDDKCACAVERLRNGTESSSAQCCASGYFADGVCACAPGSVADGIAADRDDCCMSTYRDGGGMCMCTPGPIDSDCQLDACCQSGVCTSGMCTAQEQSNTNGDEDAGDEGEGEDDDNADNDDGGSEGGGGGGGGNEGSGGPCTGPGDGARRARADPGRPSRAAAVGARPTRSMGRVLSSLHSRPRSVRLRALARWTPPTPALPASS